MTEISPCVRICRFSPATGLCLGCRRSIDEIAAWPTLSEEERRAIMAELGGRDAAGGFWPEVRTDKGGPG